MANRLKVLGQLLPAANTLSTVYSVPANNTSIVSTITLCNIGASNATASIAVQPANATINGKHYIAFNSTIPSYDTLTLTLGIGLAATDVISANVSVANVAIGVFGSEIY